MVNYRIQYQRIRLCLTAEKRGEMKHFKNVLNLQNIYQTFTLALNKLCAQFMVLVLAFKAL